MLGQRSPKTAIDREVDKTQKVTRTKSVGREALKTQEKKNMDKNDKFINIQLFGDEPKAENNENLETDKASEPDKKQNEEPKKQEMQEKVVSKELFDRTSNELAQLKKELKELKDVGKSTEQKAQDALAELEVAKKQKQEELDGLVIKLNKANSLALLSEIKSKINFTEKDIELDSIINELVTLDGEKTNTRINTFKGLIEKVYNKGFEQAKQGSWSSMSNTKANTASKSKSGYADYQDKINKEKQTNKIEFNKK